MRIAIVLCALAAAAHADPCSDPAVTPRLAALVHARRFADAHHAATDLNVQCGAQDAWRLLDDIALLRLEDRAYALQDLTNLRTPASEVVLAWAYISNRAAQAASAVLPRLPGPRRAALQALAVLDDEDAFAAAARGLDPRALALGHRYHDARVKSPALAGVLSAVLPGSGQLYSGSLSAAAVTFVLNGLFIGATVELARDKQYVTAAAAGTAASFFYIGGIINAADLARRRNRIAQQPYEDELEELLVPEVGGTLGP
jgi:TM2 domain-containing membrane protein YozV